MIRTRLFYLATLCGGWAFYLFYSGWLSAFTLGLLLVLPFVSLVLSWPAARAVSAALRTEHPTAQKGEALSFLLTFTNRGLLPAMRVSAVLTVAHTPGGREKPRPIRCAPRGHGQQVAEVNVSSQFCGVLVCTAERLRCLDYLGLFSFSLGDTQTAQVLILPRIVTISPEIISAPRPAESSESHGPASPEGDPAETQSSRIYQPGDPLRAVHWKLSGRMEELMVREFARPSALPVELLVDLCGTVQQQDILIDALASLAHFLMAQQIPVRVSRWGGAGGALVSDDVQDGDALRPVLLTLWAQQGGRGLALAQHLTREDGPPCARLFYFTAQWGEEERTRLATAENATALVALETAQPAPQGACALTAEHLANTLSTLMI